MSFKGLNMKNFRAVIDGGHNQQESKAANLLLIADEAAASLHGGRVVTSLAPNSFIGIALCPCRQLCTQVGAGGVRAF
jgi:hypothetical protein